MLKMIAALVAGASIFALSTNLEAAEVYRETTANIIVIDGTIDYDTPKKVRYALARFNNVAGFVINSLGGSMLAARELQQMVAGTGTSKVTVPAYGVCASACVDVLFAAATPQAHTTSRIGVHLGVAKATGATVIDQYATKFYRVRGVPETVITKMNSTPPSSLYWVSDAEFKAIPGAKLFTDGLTINQFVDRAQYRVWLK